MEDRVVGVLGGGQLGRMLIEAATRLQLKIRVLDSPDTPAFQISGPHTPGSFQNEADIAELAKHCALLTIEIEHVNASNLSNLTIPVHPAPSTIAMIQDKYLQKEFLKKNDVDVAEFAEIRQGFEREDIIKYANQFGGFPLMLKLRKWSYDGKGNQVVKSEADIESSLKQLGSHKAGPMYCEKMLKFKKELSVIVVRSIQGDVVSYPTVETIQRDNICHVVIAPAQIPAHVAENAKKLSQKAVSKLEGAGIFAVESFWLENDHVVVNEIAPRPHNSGHFTIDACETSQFENHLRAICGLPLGSTKMKVPCCVMVNVLGVSESWKDSLVPCIKALEIPGAAIHLYGKKDSRKARKIGHINIVGDDFGSVFEKTNKLLDIIENPRTTVLKAPPLVGIIMGSDSDLRIMSAAVEIMKKFNISHECTVVSAHRTPDRMFKYAKTAHERGIKVIIAGAGGAAHLPGMVAAITPLPVIGVPIALAHFSGQDSLLSIVQMPRGVPVATVAVDNAQNAGLLAVRILSTHIPRLLQDMIQFQNDQEGAVMGKVEIMKKSYDNDYDE
ncbi:hypothetical protein HK098_008094 [Nowakowskiella sp. JEL0407]|nr:hypothetical protein HK098_008080 [Nowakowskiella sp. JEL0407]KAJ3129860.1 hypothetical protein HK098_008094 [Nowakowskiella sp. JEL0407]